MPLPANMIQGIDAQRRDFERGLPSYLGGKWADHGWWHYYSYALAIKIPLGTWCLVVMAAGVSFRGSGYSASFRDEMVVVAPGLLIFLFVSSQTGLSVHSRYAIPALPFLFIWVSKIARVMTMNLGSRLRLTVAALTVMAITWAVASSLWIYPHSLSYFNELVGGPSRGAEHLLNSNIDWGQDLFFLRDWLKDHPSISLDGLACFGSLPAPLAGIARLPLPPGAAKTGWTQGARERGPEPGWYALSVNCLHDRSREYYYFRRFRPAAMAGYSIYIYHITEEDANRVRRQLGLPELSDKSSQN